MLKKMYETGYDQHVANYVAYLHTDKKLYEDEGHKTQVKNSTKTYLPVAMLPTGVVVTDGTTPTTCTMAE